MKKILFSILLLPNLALADVDLYTYGGFSTVVNGYKYMANVFGSSNYAILVFSILMLSILLSALINTAKGLTGKGKGGDVLSSLFLALFGFTVYQATIIPKTTVHVYDTVLNQYEAVNDVPMLIANLSNAVNIFERVGNDTFTGSTMNRNSHGAGATLHLLSKAMSTDPLKYNPYLSKSIGHYIDSCLPPALTSSSGSYAGFDLNKIVHATDSLITELGKLASTFQLTLYYDASNRGGINVTCATAWSNISSLITTPGTYNQHYLDACKTLGYKDDAPGIAKCRTSLSEMSAHLLNSTLTVNENTIAGNQALAQSLYTKLVESPSYYMQDMINLKGQVSGLSALTAAAGWLPTIRYSTMMLIVGIMPFLALMLMTPMFGKALKYMGGLLLFTTVWSICDTAIHGITMANIQEQMQAMNSTKFSVYTFMTAPNELQKAIATMGKMQSMGLVLSTVLMGVFFGISGHAFGNMGEKIQGDIDGLAKESGMEAFNPNQRQQGIDNYASTMNNSKFLNDVGAERYGQATGYESSKQKMANDAYFGTVPNNIDSYDAMLTEQEIQGGQRAGSVTAMTDSATQNDIINPYNNIGGHLQTPMNQAFSQGYLNTQQGVENTNATDVSRDSVSDMSGQDRTDNLTDQKISSDISELARFNATENLQNATNAPNVLASSKAQANSNVRAVTSSDQLRTMQENGDNVNDSQISIADKNGGATMTTLSFDQDGTAFNVGTNNESSASQNDLTSVSDGFNGSKGILKDLQSDNPELRQELANDALIDNEESTKQSLISNFAESTYGSMSASDSDSSNKSINAGISAKADLPDIISKGLGKITNMLPGDTELPNGIGGTNTKPGGMSKAFDGLGKAAMASPVMRVISALSPEISAGANWTGSNVDRDSREANTKAVFAEILDQYQEMIQSTDDMDEKERLSQEAMDVSQTVSDAMNAYYMDLAEEMMDDIPTEDGDSVSDLLSDLNELNEERINR